MANKRDLLTEKELSQLEEQGYTPRGVGFAKDNKFVSGKEIDEAVGQIRIKDDVESIKKALIAISSSLGVVENIINKFVSKQQAEEYRREEAQLEAVPETRARITDTVSKDTGQSFTDIFKELLLNPATIAAFSGIAYMLIPQEARDKIDAFFSGFTDGLEESFKELDTFKIALISAGAGLSTFLGAKVLQSIGDAITSVASLISKAKTTFGKLKKAPKSIGKSIGGAIGANKAAVAGGAVAAGTAGALMATQDGDQPQVQPESSAPVGPIPQMSEPMDKASPAASSRSLSSSSRRQEPTPQITGDDASVMAMIKQHEGVRTKPYKDSLGLWTVGVGHLIGDGRSLPPEYNREFTMDEINRLFAKDYVHHKQAAEKIPGYDKLDEKGKAALIDLTFNMGPAWYKKWPILQAQLKEGDTEGAAKNLESSLWYRQVGRRGPTIVSLIRNSEVQGGFDSSTSEMSSVAAAPVLESPSASQGSTILASSESAEQMYSSEPQTMTNMIDASRIQTGKEGVQPPPPIPSPVANRGSLAFNTRHASYA